MGNGNDIPLEEIVEKFDAVTIVDLAQDAVIKRVEQLSSIDQSKCTIIVSDISNIGLQYGDALLTLCQSIIQTGSKDPLNTFTLGAKQIIEQLPIQRQNYGTGYDFACSSLIMSQLYAQMHNFYNFLENELRDRFPQAIKDETIVNAFENTVLELGTILQSEHITLLEKALNINGTLYLADTFYYTQINRENSLFRLIDGEQFDEDLEVFTERKKERWLWLQPDADEEITFVVEAYILNKKTSSRR